MITTRLCYGQIETESSDSLYTQNEYSYKKVESKAWKEIAQESLIKVKEKQQIQANMNGGIILNPVKSDDELENIQSVIRWSGIFILGCLFLGILISIYTVLTPKTNSRLLITKYLGNPIKLQYVFLGSLMLGIITFSICMIVFRPFRYDNWSDNAIPSSFFDYANGAISWIRGDGYSSIESRKLYLIKKSLLIGSICSLVILMVFCFKIMTSPNERKSKRAWLK